MADSNKPGVGNVIKEIMLSPSFLARRALRKHVRFLSSQIRGKTLDVGCGCKPYEDFFGDVTEYIGMEIEGYDVNSASVDILYDGKVFPLENESFDSAVTFQVLEHVREPDAFMEEVSRILKAGGMLLLSVPFIWDEHEQPHDYRRYTSMGIRKLLEEHGFDVLYEYKTVNDFSIVFQLMNLYINKQSNFFGSSKSGKAVKAGLFFVNNILGSVFSLLPKNNDMYLDNVILAKKIR